MKHIRRESRNFQRGYKVNTENAIPNTPLKIGFPNWMIREVWENRERISFPSRIIKEDFFQSSTYLEFKQTRLDNKQSKKDAIIAERLVHNKSLDGLTCKQRRNKKRLELITPKNGKNS